MLKINRQLFLIFICTHLIQGSYANEDLLQKDDISTKEEDKIDFQAVNLILAQTKGLYNLPKIDPGIKIGSELYAEMIESHFEKKVMLIQKKDIGKKISWAFLQMTIWATFLFVFFWITKRVSALIIGIAISTSLLIKTGGKLAGALLNFNFYNFQSIVTNDEFKRDFKSILTPVYIPDWMKYIHTPIESIWNFIFGDFITLSPVNDHDEIANKLATKIPVKIAVLIAPFMTLGSLLGPFYVYMCICFYNVMRYRNLNIENMLNSPLFKLEKQYLVAKHRINKHNQQEIETMLYLMRINGYNPLIASKIRQIFSIPKYIHMHKPAPCDIEKFEKEIEGIKPEVADRLREMFILCSFLLHDYYKHQDAIARGEMKAPPRFTIYFFGEPGSGKTTLLRTFIKCLLGEDMIPLEIDPSENPSEMFGSPETIDNTNNDLGALTNALINANQQKELLQNDSHTLPFVCGNVLVMEDADRIFGPDSEKKGKIASNITTFFFDPTVKSFNNPSVNCQVALPLINIITANTVLDEQSAILDRTAALQMDDIYLPWKIKAIIQDFIQSHGSNMFDEMTEEFIEKGKEEIYERFQKQPDKSIRTLYGMVLNYILDEQEQKFAKEMMQKENIKK